MKKFKLVAKVVNYEEIEEISCNMCGIELGKTEYEFEGGYFLPCFNWASKYERDEHLNDNQIHMCDNCWEKFFDSMMMDPRGPEEEDV